LNPHSRTEGLGGEKKKKIHKFSFELSKGRGLRSALRPPGELERRRFRNQTKEERKEQKSAGRVGGGAEEVAIRNILIGKDGDQTYALREKDTLWIRPRAARGQE